MESVKSQGTVTWVLKAAVLVFFLSIYLVTRPAGLYSIDSENMFWVCQSLVEDGDLDVSNQIVADTAASKSDGWFSYQVSRTIQFPLVPSLVGVPFYVAGKWGSRLLGRPLSSESLFAVVGLSGAVLMALSCWLLFQFILAMGFSLRAAFLATCFYGLGTIVWAHTHFLDTEPITTLAVLGAAYTAYLYKMRGRYLWLFLSGVLCGVAAGSRELAILLVAPPVLIYLLATGWRRAPLAPGRAYLIEGLHRLAVFLLGLLPFLLLNIWYTFARYGVLTNVDYIGHGGAVSDIFHYPLVLGLYGFLLSPGRSLFLYCPVLLLVFFSVRPFYRTHRAELLLFLSVFLLHLLVYAKCIYWSGGTSFGPRYLIPAIPLLALPIAVFLETLPARPPRTQLLILLLFCVSVVIQTAPLWGYVPSAWQIKDTAQVLNDDDLDQYIPQGFPLLWKVKSGKDFIGQFYFMPKKILSLRFPILLILLGTALGAGRYLVRRVELLPSRARRGALTRRMIALIRTRIRILLAYRAVAAWGALGGLLLAAAFYIAFEYIWVPFSQFNSKPFGVIESPREASSPFSGAPIQTGKMDIRGWVLDRSGIAAVEVYIDGVKVADAAYGQGEPSSDVQALYPHIAGSDRARYQATGIDTARFRNGRHLLLVKARNQTGAWADIAVQGLVFLNEKPYDLWAHRAEVTASGGEALQDSLLAIRQESRRVLLQRLDSSVTFDGVPVGEKAVLKLGLGLASAAGSGGTHDLVLEVIANSSVPLFTWAINPRAYAENPQWHDHRIDLSSFQNQVISLTLSVRTPSGPGSDTPTSTRVAWGPLAIEYPELKTDSE